MTTANTNRLDRFLASVIKVTLASFALLILIPIIFVAYNLGYIYWNTYSYNFKLGIEVQVGDELRSAYSVIGVSVSENPEWVRELDGGVNVHVRGEAVFLDLGQGRNVILTVVSGEYGDQQNCQGFPTIAFKPRKDYAYREAAYWQGQANFEAKKIPTLVTFSNLNDPKTGKTVKSQDFEHVFGSDVHFKRAYVEITNEDITERIMSEISFLEGLFSQNHFTAPGRLDITPTLFRVNR
jgi:hypothetical protein